MEALIKKAIDAITEGKTERAVGLLEGALEMSVFSKVKDFSDGFTIARQEERGDSTLRLFSPVTHVTSTVPLQDEATIMEAKAAASLAEIKRLSELSGTDA